MVMWDEHNNQTTQYVYEYYHDHPVDIGVYKTPRIFKNNQAFSHHNSTRRCVLTIPGRGISIIPPRVETVSPFPPFDHGVFQLVHRGGSY